MSRSISRKGTAVCGAALVALILPATGSATLGGAGAAAPSGITASDTDPQGGPTDDNEYVGRADRTDDKPGDRKAGGFGPVGERTSTMPDVPGASVVADTLDPARSTATPKPVGDSAARLRAVAKRDGTVRVIAMMGMRVGLEAKLTRQQVRDQRAAIADRLRTLDRTLAGTKSRILTRFTVVPSAVVVADRRGLEALLTDRRVAALTQDRLAPLALDVSTGVIDSDLLNTAGMLGNNFEGSTTGAYEVAILDSGVDNQHTAFTGRIVAEACFSGGSDCPNGATSQSGAGSADNCTYSVQCDHGTHVAGIAAGNTFTGGHEGVARGARIVGIQIGSRFDDAGTCGGTIPCWRYFFSDLDLALQHTLNLRNGGRNISAVNLSLGGPLHATEVSCGSAFPNTQNLASNLAAANAPVVAAAGNDGSGTHVSYPGCLPSAYTVAASDDADVPAGFSNNNAITNWWAPGVNIDAPVTSSTTAHGNKSGTSMATPHVVGAMALLRECVDGNGVPQTAAAAASDLNNTGVNITHDGVTRKRINVLDAATSNVNNNDFASPETLPATPAAGGFNDFDFTVCSDTEPGEPGPFSLDNGIWYSWTPSVTGMATISTDDGGGNVTTFDTTLAIYKGNTLGTLETYGFDDDAGVGLRSLITVPVQGGTTYRIKVDGFGAANGLLNLHIENGPVTCQGVGATLVGGNASDTIMGTPGDDVIVSALGDDTINALGGNDRVCSDAGADDVATGDGNDLVFGGPDADIVKGGANDDTLLGNAGGGDTNDVGDTVIGGTGNDHLDGWVGDDTLVGGVGNDALRGEAGVDTADFSDATSGVTADLAAGTATGQGSDTFFAVENLVGSGFQDQLVGDAAVNVLTGGARNDRVNGGAESDTLLGGGGADLLRGLAGDDTIGGGPGKDTVAFNHALAAVQVDLAAGTATGEGTDTLTGNENVVGSDFADTLLGSAIINKLFGGNQGDTIRGRDGNDKLFGQNGPDALFGEGGNDALDGGPQNDACSGGSGTNTLTNCE